MKKEMDSTYIDYIELLKREFGDKDHTLKEQVFKKIKGKINPWVALISVLMAYIKTLAYTYQLGKFYEYGINAVYNITGENIVEQFLFYFAIAIMVLFVNYFLIIIFSIKKGKISKLLIVTLILLIENALLNLIIFPQIYGLLKYINKGYIRGVYFLSSIAVLVMNMPSFFMVSYLKSKYVIDKKNFNKNKLTQYVKRRNNLIANKKYKQMKKDHKWSQIMNKWRTKQQTTKGEIKRNWKVEMSLITIAMMVAYIGLSWYMGFQDAKNNDTYMCIVEIPREENEKNEEYEKCVNPKDGYVYYAILHEMPDSYIACILEPDGDNFKLNYKIKKIVNNDNLILTEMRKIKH